MNRLKGMFVKTEHQDHFPMSSPPLRTSVTPPELAPPELPSATPPKLPYRRPLYYRPIFWLVLTTGAIATTGLTRTYRIWHNTEASLPPVENLKTFERQGTITIKADNGTVLQKIGPATRDKVAYDQMPETLVAAFVASEDQRFYEHRGIDFQGIARAILANVRQRDVVEGASTITQQLARIAFLDQERSFQRKAREALLALKIEDVYSKEEIIERYLNLVYLGAGAYGVADAAWIYFGKTVDQLTVSEAALIAGMAPAPSFYSPLVDPQAATGQRDIVIHRMLENGKITQAEAAEALAEEVATTPKQPKFIYSEFPYFTIYIQKQLTEILPPEVVEAGGLVVETTLNVDWQRKAQATIQETVATIGSQQRFSQAALVAVDPRNGEIKAVVGGTDFNDSQFNRATQALRQPGSTFKTFVYTTAIAAGFSPYKGYTDARYVVDGYEPKNYDGSYSGDVDLRTALTSSINIVAVKLIVDVGFDPVIAMAKRMGIESNLLPTYSLALGASEVTLLELTSAYGTLANKGKHVPVHGIRRVLDSSGAVIYEVDKTPTQAVDETTAAIMTWMLRGVVEGGTGSRASIDRPVAGKTGTSEENRDLWFVGYIPQLVVGVWLGNDDNSRTWGVSSTAAYTWQQFVSQLLGDIPPDDFSPLPPLGGRRGSIKAQPVKPGKVIAEKFTTPSARDNSPVEEAPVRRSEPEAPAAEPSQPQEAPANQQPPSSTPPPAPAPEPPPAPAPEPPPAPAPEPPPAPAPEPPPAPAPEPPPAPAPEPPPAPAPEPPPPAGESQE
jgi:penicillin-binding protein 1A